MKKIIALFCAIVPQVGHAQTTTCLRVYGGVQCQQSPAPAPQIDYGEAMAAGANLIPDLNAQREAQAERRQRMELQRLEAEERRLRIQALRAQIARDQAASAPKAP